MKHEGMAVWRETHRGVTDIKTDTLYHSVNSCQKEKQVKEKPWQCSTHLQTILLLFFFPNVGLISLFCVSALLSFCFYTVLYWAVIRSSVQPSFIHSFYLLNPFVHSFFSPVNPLNPPLEMRPIPAYTGQKERKHPSKVQDLHLTASVESAVDPQRSLKSPQANFSSSVCFVYSG